MDERSLELFQADKLEMIGRDIAALSCRQPGRSFEAEHHVTEHVEPWEQSGLLEHHQAVTAGPFDGLIVSQYMALIRKGQARQDIEQRRLAAAARADQTNKLTLLDAQIDIIQRQHRGARGAKPLGYPFDDELGRRGGLQLKTCCGHGFSTSRDKSGALRRNPTDCAVDISALRASSD